MTTRLSGVRQLFSRFVATISGFVEGGPPPIPDDGLDFSSADNSMYVPLF